MSICVHTYVTPSTSVYKYKNQLMKPLDSLGSCNLSTVTIPMLSSSRTQLGSLNKDLRKQSVDDMVLKAVLLPHVGIGLLANTCLFSCEAPSFSQSTDRTLQTSLCPTRPQLVPLFFSPRDPANDGRYGTGARPRRFWVPSLLLLP